MTKDELITLFRNQVMDTAQPYLWSDEEVEEYADDAQNMFVRLIGGIRDATSDLCTLDAPAGETFVSYDPRILKIRHAERSDGTELTITDWEDHQNAGTQPRLTNVPGALTGLVLGVDDANIRLSAIPAVADTISLVINRLPLNLDLSEIQAHHHPHLVAWMKHRAYNKQDAETFDKGKASEFLDQFTKYCLKSGQERSVRSHKAGTVVYGGI
jgi:hypothetical protein